MWSKLSKNGIINGPMEAFCLVCECLVGNLDKIDKHIEDPYHGKKLGMYPHLEKYTGDRIRKIKGVYLCEFCSVILNTATKVNAHICTRKHVNNRGLQQLRAGPNNGVIALDELLINEDAWHTIDDKCCSLCCEEDVDSKHKHSPNHLMKLVQSKIEFVQNGLYRKIDENTIQCLTCNILLDTNSINNHFDSEDHKAASTKCKETDDNANGEIKTENTNDKPGSSKLNTNKVNNDPKDVMSEVEEIKKMAKDNKITYNLGHDTAYCRVCEVRMPPTVCSMKEHVAGMKHINKLKSNMPKLVTKPVNAFIDDLQLVETMFCVDMVINLKMCIELSSFVMITKNSERLRCLVCEQTLNEDFLEDHLKIARHRKAVHESPIVTTFDTEFLRKIRPGVFHCGFCNILVTKWDDVPSHLESADHKFKKGSCQHRLSEHLPDLKEMRGRRQFTNFMIMRMLQELPFMFK